MNYFQRMQSFIESNGYKLIIVRCKRGYRKVIEGWAYRIFPENSNGHNRNHKDCILSTPPIYTKKKDDLTCVQIIISLGGRDLISQYEMETLELLRG